MGIGKVLTKAAQKAAKKRKKPRAASRLKTRSEKKVEFEGARADPDTGRSANVGRSVEETNVSRGAKGSGKTTNTSGKTNIGSKSINNFINDQRASSPGMKARTVEDKAYAAYIKAAPNKKEKAKRQAEYDAVKAKRRKADEKQAQRTANRSATTRRANAQKKKAEAKPDDFMQALETARKTGELGPAYERLLPNQQKQIERAAAAFARTEDPDVTTKKVLKGKLARMTAGDTGSRMNKGGMMKKGIPVITIGLGMAAPKGKKKRTGSTDYRNGGMVMSTIDNLTPAQKNMVKKMAAANKKK